MGLQREGRLTFSFWFKNTRGLVLFRSMLASLPSELYVVVVVVIIPERSVGRLTNETAQPITTGTEYVLKEICTKYY